MNYYNTIALPGRVSAKQRLDSFNPSEYKRTRNFIKGKVSKLRLLTYTKLLFAIKTLERAGDHIENIAEEIHFIVTGEHIDLKRNTTDNKLEDAIEESNK